MEVFGGFRGVFLGGGDRFGSFGRFFVNFNLWLSGGFRLEYWFNVFMVGFIDCGSFRELDGGFFGMGCRSVNYIEDMEYFRGIRFDSWLFYEDVWDLFDVDIVFRDFKCMCVYFGGGVDFFGFDFWYE